jgi:site-specific recombinase XerD
MTRKPPDQTKHQPSPQPEEDSAQLVRVAAQQQRASTLRHKVADYLQTGLQGAVNTQRAYTTDLNHYRQWCAATGEPIVPVSPEILCQYLAHVAETDKWATIQRRLATIRKLHLLQGADFPAKDQHVVTVLEGIRRTIGSRQRQAPAFDLADLRIVLKGLDMDNPQELRDKVVLLVGFAGAFRRSELVALNLEQCQFQDEEAIISLSRSKTNQYAEAEEKALFAHADPDLCPVHTLKRWLALRPATGPLLVRFRKGVRPGNLRLTDERLSDKSVDNIVKQYLGKAFSAHSLRASFVTIAKLNGADDLEVMQQTKHKTSAMIQRYTRVNNIRKYNAGRKLGL